MACHRIPKQVAMDLKPSDVTRTVSDMALITKAVDKPLSQYMTAGYLEPKLSDFSFSLKKALEIDC